MDDKITIDELLYFSNKVCNISLYKIQIGNLIYLESEEFFHSEYKEPSNYFMQNMIIRTEEKIINLILKNLEQAIATNCGNSVNLKSVSVSDDWGYSFKENHDERVIKKRYTQFRIRPNNETEFKLMWLKIFIEDLKKIVEIINNILSPTLPKGMQKPNSIETELSEKIKNHFGFFNGLCPRKHRQILKNEDFDNLIEWTIKYFENNFNVPEISYPIRVVNTNKTYVQLAFRYLFKELHKSSPYPNTLFEFYKSAFSPYSEDKKSNFEAVKNNDEVKKLMKIKY
jgi:hypothetical protein